MLKRAFTKKEEAILLVLVIFLLGMVYYQFVYKWQVRSIAEFDTTQIDSQILMEQSKAAKIKKMQDEIAQGKKEKSGVVETYNNLKQELNALNDIFGEALKFDFGFDQATAEGDAVRRVINASFTATDYQAAKDMIRKLHDCEYRCLIGDISIAPANVSGSGNEKNLNKGMVAVNFTVTFYETLYEATNTDGLAILSTASSEDDTSMLDTLAASKTEVENMGNE